MLVLLALCWVVLFCFMLLIRSDSHSHCASCSHTISGITEAAAAVNQAALTLTGETERRPQSLGKLQRALQAFRRYTRPATRSSRNNKSSKRKKDLTEQLLKLNVSHSHISADVCLIFMRVLVSHGF